MPAGLFLTPMQLFLTPMQGVLVQTFTADGSVLPYRFVSIIGTMQVGQTMPGMLGIGIAISVHAVTLEDKKALVQSTGLVKVLVDKEVQAGDPVCIGPQGGITPIEANGHLVGIAVEGGEVGDAVKVWLNIATDFESAVQPFATRRLANARRAVSGVVKPKRIVGRYISLDG